MAEKDVLVCVQLNNEKIINVSLEMLNEGRKLSLETGGALFACLLGREGRESKKILNEYGVKKAYAMDKEIPFWDNIYAEHLLKSINESHPSVVLVGTTPEGKSVAALCASKLHTGLTADCTEIALDEKDRLIQTRPAYGGKIMADIITENARPQMVTIREGVFEKTIEAKHRSKKTYECEIVTLKVAEEKKRALIEKDIKEDDYPLKNSSVVIAIGAGVEIEEDIKKFYDLAEQMNAALGSSRALVEKGWMPKERQIGLTGCAISPKLLICVGISGSVQFCAGVKKAGKIIAVNSDRDAGIFRICDEYIISDYKEIFDLK